MNDRYDHLESELLTMRRRMRRLTATNLVLAVAVLAFGGAGAAYALAAANSVNSAAIIDGTIITPDLKNGALSGTKILDNAVTGADVNEATLDLPIDVKTARTSQNVTSGQWLNVFCPLGYVATGGGDPFGSAQSSEDGAIDGEGSYVDNGETPLGWAVRNTTGGNADLQAQVICIKF